eukprot:CAMPEP_0204605502 /NCGR_PEP_ID=MMETSP0661-20131031/58522_1 /ASSEMBLY_ACC=CAM_ASM_000606 /TAXON_ID=109239 /ORGANISM="Alexandrium margalefi, Strain AMGDE01CS-322" /LENGTH=47 /DNA_ID= /DNA_START= /DNA_END= /DNA_ORIENTATION=
MHASDLRIAQLQAFWALGVGLTEADGRVSGPVRGSSRRSWSSAARLP